MIEIFQRTSIGVRVATSTFADHSEQVVSISLTSENPTPFPFVVLTSILTSFKSRWSKKFLFDTLYTLRATSQNPLKDFFYLFIKKPITKYCILARVCHILFFIFLKYTCIYCRYVIMSNSSYPTRTTGGAGPPLGSPACKNLFQYYLTNILRYAIID